MGLQHYTQDMSRIPLKYHINVLFYTKYTHPTLICRGTDGRTENIYSIFRDKLLLLREPDYCKYNMYFNKNYMYSIVGIDKKTYGEGIGITYIYT